MSKKSKKKSGANESVEVLQQEADRAFEAGDYRTTRELDQRIAAASPESKQGLEAGRRFSQLGVDPVVVKFGIGVLVLYLLGWFVGTMGQ